MSHELKEGLSLSIVTAPNNNGIWEVGEQPHQASSITVRMQMGEMSMVPWAEVITNDGNTIFLNLAHMDFIRVRSIAK